MGNNRNEKLGVKGIDLLLKPEPFVVNQEAFNRKGNYNDDKSNNDIQDFTQQPLESTSIADDLDLNY